MRGERIRRKVSRTTSSRTREREIKKEALRQREQRLGSEVEVLVERHWWGVGKEVQMLSWQSWRRPWDMVEGRTSEKAKVVIQVGRRREVAVRTLAGVRLVFDADHDLTQELAQRREIEEASK